MKRCVLLIMLFFNLYACNPHHYRIEGDHVILFLRYPEAEEVLLFCSLDGFRPRIADKVTTGWASELPAGEGFSYFYRIDDELFVPDCAMKEKDDFGFENCIYEPHL